MKVSDIIQSAKEAIEAIAANGSYNYKSLIESIRGHAEVEFLQYHIFDLVHAKVRECPESEDNFGPFLRALMNEEEPQPEADANCDWCAVADVLMKHIEQDTETPRRELLGDLYGIINELADEDLPQHAFNLKVSLLQKCLSKK